MHMVQDEAGDRSSENIGDGYGGHEQGNGLSLFPALKPISQVQQNAGVVTGFSQSEQETRDIELVHGLHKASESCDRSPNDKNARDPDAGANPVQDQVAGNLEDRVANKKDADKKPKLLAGDAEFLVHG